MSINISHKEQIKLTKNKCNQHSQHQHPIEQHYKSHYHGARQLAISMVCSSWFNNNWNKMSQSWSSQVWIVFLFCIVNSINTSKMDKKIYQFIFSSYLMKFKTRCCVWYDKAWSISVISSHFFLDTLNNMAHLIMK